MTRQLQVVLVLAILLVSEWTLAYHPDLSWQNMDSLMNGDLRHRMSKKIPTRRRYCECSEVDAQDMYPVCAINGALTALYENACLFQCAKVRSPQLEETDIAKCGSETFKEFKQSEFRRHY